MLVSQLAQRSNLGQHLVRSEEVRCTADLHLSSQINTAHRAGENHLVGSVITTLQSTAGENTHSFDWHTLVPRIYDMLTLGNTSDNEPPLGMEEARISGRIIPIWAETELIDILLRHGQIMIIPRLVDERKDAIGDANGIENHKETTGLEKNPFHVCLASQAFTPAGQIKKPRHILGMQAGDDILGVERGLDALLGPPERSRFGRLSHDTPWRSREILGGYKYRDPRKHRNHRLERSWGQ